MSALSKIDTLFQHGSCLRGRGILQSSPIATVTWNKLILAVFLRRYGSRGICHLSDVKEVKYRHGSKLPCELVHLVPRE